MTAVDSLQREIEEIAATPGDQSLPHRTEVVVQTLLNLLERGEVRAAECVQGKWTAVQWVKRGILLGFRFGRLVEMESARPFSFVDKHLYPAREFGIEDRVRIVPGGSTVRRGAYVSPSVVCMPPMYVNVGAWVGQGTMIDSHALVGSCAQIGDKVHLSAAAQIGGVLEPVNASPVVIEDGVMVGGNCGVYEGTVVRHGAVLGAGVILTRATPVYDLVHETVYRAGADQPLEIPANAVVVPGARRVARGWGADEGLSLQTPVIVKYRDEKTDVATTLEQWLR
ncbi:MAG TPA: 2,3,4,5-tetrahydropyridine-2,6-dicarboxylate N-succinyltransferase [Gemmatimonadaceae bacterium]